MHRADWFSGARLAHLPSAEEVPGIAADVQAYWALQGVSPFNPAEAFRLLGWEIRYRALVIARCQHSAMLVPLLRGGFVVLVDAALAQSAASDAGSDLVRAVLTHELAHSFFYAASAPPERLLPLKPEEELFCDAFASEMLQRHAGAA